MNYKEILLLIWLTHGFYLSMPQLKRILKSRGLGRRINRSDLQKVSRCIEVELRGSGSTIGYRQMTQRLSRVYGLCVDKDTVRNLLKVLDPEGVEAPSGRPDILYFLPEINGARNLITVVSLDDVEIAEQRCCNRPPETGCTDEFCELASVIMQEKNIEMPKTAEDTVILYSVLTDEIQKLL